ncbi:MAG: ATP-dependent DNA helicase RecG [Proteobacteria bacterium]|nr:ATP-dependent DNA helicase RecG [Pseudomonadota bacterium]
MRPEILFPLFASITSLKGVGPKLQPLVEKTAGPLVRDLLFTPPSAIVERPRRTTAELTVGQTATVEVTVAAHDPAPRGGRFWRIRTFDEHGFLSLIWFKGFSPHLERAHPPGARRVVSGKVDRWRDSVELQMVHPDYVVPADKAAEVPSREVVYPTTAGLPSRTLWRLCLQAVERAPELPEWQDGAWRARNAWPGWREALVLMHTPEREADLSPTAPARMRLAYDELLAHQLAMARRKGARRAEPARRLPQSELSRRVEAALPYRLTGAQQRASSEIGGDLTAGRRMSRLLQGDVGAGKTAVAMLAMADAVAAGAQAAIMAPTEILARQHFESLRPVFGAVGVPTVLLTGRDKGAARAERLRALASGTASVAVGTHALFQEEVAFADLSLAVIDEQHRFGVNERNRLLAKGDGVHLLAMSATPIPRTLELTVFGDLDVSRIDEKPPGRTPVVTAAVPTTRMSEVVARLKRALAEGQQAFWICPLVSESESADLAAAEARAAELQALLGPHVGLVHGKLTGPAKDAVMGEFAEGRLGLLVATTVVEVGVDVPNASIMVIEQAERFGLAQLHQLRGRVGRGLRESACLLLFDPPLSETARARLEVLRETDDGFLIAEKDLELRGGGDPLGLKQSGFPAYRLADPVLHRELLAAAADDARLVLARDPDLGGERGRALALLSELFDWRPDGGSGAG